MTPGSLGERATFADLARTLGVPKHVVRYVVMARRESAEFDLRRDPVTDRWTFRVAAALRVIRRDGVGGA